ncbi:MAG: response regulator [Burkholderiaceae bacterium]
MTLTHPIRILVVDDHTLFRRGLIALLTAQAQAQFAVVGEAGDANQAQRLMQTLQPDVLLLDNHLPGVQGIDALPDLRTACPTAKILMLTVSEDSQTLATALRRGANGYLLKTVDSDGLTSAIERVMRGESSISPEMTGKLVDAYQSLQAGAAAVSAAVESQVDLLQQLSPRELEILTCVAQGQSNKEIARSLNIAETTVKIHVQHILRKLKLSSRVQAAVYAAERKL